MNTKTGIFKATLAAGAVLIGAQAYAHTVAFFTRTGNFPITSVPQVVPLNQNGALGVTYTGSGRRTITYTAECVTSASWVTIAIFVDGVPLPPTGNSIGDAFCSSSSGFVMASAMGRTASLPAGTHTVRVVAHFLGAGIGFLNDSALKIER